MLTAPVRPGPGRPGAAATAPGVAAGRPAPTCLGGAGRRGALAVVVVVGLRRPRRPCSTSSADDPASRRASGSATWSSFQLPWLANLLGLAFARPDRRASVALRDRVLRPAGRPWRWPRSPCTPSCSARPPPGTSTGTTGRCCPPPSAAAYVLARRRRRGRHGRAPASPRRTTAIGAAVAIVVFVGAFGVLRPDQARRATSTRATGPPELVDDADLPRRPGRRSATSASPTDRMRGSPTTPTWRRSRSPRRRPGCATLAAERPRPPGADPRWPATRATPARAVHRHHPRRGGRHRRRRHPTPARAGQQLLGASGRSRTSTG